MKTMTCQDAQAQLLDYVEGELDAASRLTLREHVAVCPQCRRELQEIERLRSALGSERVPDPEIVFWEKFPDRVLQEYRARLSAAEGPRTSSGSGASASLNLVARWWASMGLVPKFNLILLVVFAFGLGTTGYISYDVLHKNAREEVVHNAGVVLEAVLSMNGYTAREINPLLSRDAEKFHPQAIPAYAATEIMNQLRKKYSDYYYKTAVLNPMNPRNRAVGWEAEIVGSFRGNADQTEISGVRNTANGPHFYLARPSRVGSKECLHCHASPEQAPPAVVRTYGKDNGYGWKQNEIVGAQIVSVPMALPIRNANRAFFVLMVSISAVFVAVFIILNVLMRMMIVQPTRRVSSAVDENSTGLGNRGDRS